MELSNQDLESIYRVKYGDPRGAGWGPRTRLRFKYFTPDDRYEAMTAKLVQAGCAWLDVGCGRDLFPGNEALGRDLARKCALLVGVDPSDNIDENPLVHRKEKTTIEQLCCEQCFDLVTFRMVVEHIEKPRLVTQALARLVKPGGKVLIYTVNKWSPVAIIARVIPFGLHHAVKSFFWRTEERDTFPVVYAMNTRRRLKQWFQQAGFREYYFDYLDDCRAFARFRRLNWLELCTQRALRMIGLRYPENCLLGVYERIDPGQAGVAGVESLASGERLHA